MTRLFSHRICHLSILILAVLCACGGGTRVEIRSSEGPPVVDTGLGVADVFDVRVYGEAELSATFRVAPDGTISYPLIGRVVARGKTTTQLADEIQTRLQKYVKNPQVSVLLKESNSKRFTVIGLVQHPGTYSYVDQMTITQAISMAGGFAAMADRKKTTVTRRNKGETETITVDMKAVSAGRRTFYLLPGDEINVPERPF